MALPIAVRCCLEQMTWFNHFWWVYIYPWWKKYVKEEEDMLNTLLSCSGIRTRCFEVLYAESVRDPWQKGGQEGGGGIALYSVPWTATSPTLSGAWL